jgi:tRNA pseudouridine13 synthase
LKLKRLPQDFLVEELTDFSAGRGQFALYRLAKESLGTPEAIEAILRRWKLSRGDVSYGGLKDRHARTVQYVTIRGGPRRGLRQEHLELTYLGQAPRPFGPPDIAANRFEIVLRDLSPSAARQTQQSLQEVQRDGVPNYFDEQRFGSLGESGEFMARPWCEGNFERALWLALADPNPHDRPADREEKQILRQHWGDWVQCQSALPRSHRLNIVTFLTDRPGDFRGALARLRIDLRSLYLAAFQSYLWNCLLAELLRQHCRPEQLFELPLTPEPVPFYRALDSPQRDALLQAELPLPSARIHLREGPLKELVDRVLARHGLELRQIRVKYPRDSFFSKGNRRAVLLARDVRHEAADDDLHLGRRKLTLRFDLDRGSYGTMLVKRITGKDEG